MARTKIPKPVTKIFSTAHRLLYKLTGGKVGAKMSDGHIGLLTTTGRKSGKARTMPLMVLEDGNRFAVVASYSGHDVHPAWYLNLQANPTATLTMGKDKHSVTAVDAEGAERQALWDRFVSVYGDYAEYQKVTDREIPVVVLTPT